jgi:UDP-2,3-diacylglucosamine pyrophosphatase LpxH
MNYIIISDLHVGGGTNLDIFHSQSTLAGFLKSIGDEPLTLIINGDFIDFLAVEPYGIFSRKAAQQKIERIVGAAENKVLWEGFRAFLAANTANRVDILLGNHDLEIIFEEVQEAMRAVMAAAGEGERIQFITERVSHQKVKVGGVNVHVEHGFQYDPYNWYDQDELVKATIYGSTGENFKIPVGSRLVYETLNKLTPQHPFIPLIKPETAVLYILLALAPKEAAKQLDDLGIALGGKFFNRVKMRLRSQQFATPVAVDMTAGRSALDSQLTNLFLGSDTDLETVKAVEEYVGEGRGQQPGRAISFNVFSAAARKAKLYLLRKGLQGLKEERDTFFDTNASDDFNHALEGILNLNAQVAILGHSHGRKLTELTAPDDSGRKLLYLNTGTWADLLDFDLNQLQDDDALEAWLDDLDNRRFTPSLYFTFARVTELPGGRGARISLEDWREGKAHPVGEAQEVMASKTA